MQTTIMLSPSEVKALSELEPGDYLTVYPGARVGILHPLGECPACGEGVYADDDPVWTCPADLGEGNPYREDPDPNITEELSEQTGVYANCGEDYGFPCYDRLPLHGLCYEEGNY